MSFAFRLCALFAAFLCFSAHPVLASPAGPAPKKAIVLASFGSTHPAARDVETAVLREAEKRYPGTRVLLANTARQVMAKNAAAGVRIPSLFRVLADLADEGYTQVAVQSMQLLPGAEFEGLAALAKAQEGLPKGLARVSVGASLLASDADCAKVAQALAASLPAERRADDPVIFVGHGTHHGLGSLVYPALQWHLANRDPLLQVSVLEGNPDMRTTLSRLGKPEDGKKTVWLAPLLGLAGDHALNDLYGQDADSWKSLLSRQGWTVRESHLPLYSIAAVREILFEHLDAARAALDR